MCAGDAGDNAKAEEYFRAALDKNPEFPDALSNMIDMSYREQDYLQARAFMQRYLDVRPADAHPSCGSASTSSRSSKIRRAASVVPRNCAKVSQGPRSSRNSKSCQERWPYEEHNSLRRPCRQAPSSGRCLRRRDSARDFRSSRCRPSCASSRSSSTRSSRIASSVSACPCSSRAISASTGAFLGLDVRDLLAQYYKQNSLKEVQVQPSKTIKLHDERQITVWIVAALILAALVVALGIWWSNGGRLPATAPATQTSTEPAARGAAGDADVRATGAAPAVASAGAAPDLRRPRRPSAGCGNRARAPASPPRRRARPRPAMRRP